MANFVGPSQKYSGLKHHAKVHTFRIATAILAWVLIVAGLYYKPEWVQWGLRAVTRSMETIGDAIPSPWGARIEVLLREIGGFVWFQITALIIVIRIIFSSVASGWRYIRRRD